jgi:hypothetical protein
MGKRKPLEMEVRIQPDHPFFAIIEEAYRAFAVPPPSSLGVHDCGMDASVRRDLLTLPSAQLPYRHVRDWYLAEVDPAGVPRATWAYLLPRVLEILALGQPVSEISLEISLSRFATGNPDHWSAAQWAVLDRFQRLYLQRAMGRGEASAIYRSGDRLDAVLCMFRLGDWPLDRLLEQLAAMPDALLADRLWRDWCEGSPPGCEAVEITTFWPEADREAIRAWYTSPALRARMEALALADDTPAELAEQALAVAEVIAANRA